MATKFIEPGGDATFDTSLWTVFTGTPTIATDFVHGSHINSIQTSTHGVNDVLASIATVADAGGRYSLYLYVKTLPSATSSIASLKSTADVANVLRIRITSTGVLQIWDNTAQQGSNGSTLLTGVWYRISFAWKITSSTVNEGRMWVNGALDVSISNVTLSTTAMADWKIGNLSGDANIDLRTSDHYLDDSNSLTETGDIWVTAKRPNANGTTNGFTTQIGAGGSGYGAGHSPQVNERALSTTNGWSMVGAGSAITEEYNIEAISVGDRNIGTATIVDYMGWAYMSSLVAETVQFILNGASSSQAITNTNAMYKKIAGSTTYPASTGADIGITTDTSLTTVNLYECGVIFAYIPATTRRRIFKHH